MAAVTAAIPDAFVPGALHSAYLYGSIPRGTAVPGRSDLDLFLVLRAEPTAADRAAAASMERSLDDRFPEINGAGIAPVQRGHRTQRP